MPTAYTPVPANIDATDTAALTVVTDGDDVNAAGANSPWEKLADFAQFQADHALFFKAANTKVMGATAADINAVIEAPFSPYLLVAAGDAEISSSPDANTWTQRLSSALVTFNGLATDGTTIVAVGNHSGGNDIYTSVNATAWTSRTSASAGSFLGAVAFGNGVFVAIGADTVTTAQTSPTGTTWTSRTIPDIGGCYGVIYANGLFVAAGTKGIATSPTGTTWTQRLTLAGTGANQLSTVVWNGEQFIAIGVDVARYTSPDGVTWTSLGTPGFKMHCYSLASNGKRLVVGAWVGGSGADGAGPLAADALLMTADGITWESAGVYANDGAGTDDPDPAVAYVLRCVCWCPLRRMFLYGAESTGDTFRSAQIV